MRTRNECCSRRLAELYPDMPLASIEIVMDQFGRYRLEALSELEFTYLAASLCSVFHKIILAQEGRVHMSGEIAVEVKKLIGGDSG